MHDLNEILSTCQEIKGELKRALGAATFVDAEFRVNFCDGQPFYISLHGVGDLDGIESKGFERVHDAFTYLQLMQLRARALPDAETTARMVAAKELGRAIDKARENGLDVEAIAVSFQGIWENLIEDQRGRV